MLLNLAAVANSEDPQVLWGFLRRYAPDVTPRKPSAPRQAHHLCGALFPRFRPPEQEISRAGRGRARGARQRSPTCSAACPRSASAEEIQTRALRHRAADPALSGYESKGRDAGASRRLERMVQHALSGAARRKSRAALRLFRRALWHCRDAAVDRGSHQRRAARNSMRPSSKSGQARKPDARQ